jgi:hypothetical protein
MNRMLVRSVLVGALLALMLTSLGVAAGTSSARVDGRSAAASGTSGTSSRCSKATAREAATRFHLGVDPALPNPIAQVLCGAFVGPGSQAMAVSIAIPSCGRTAQWAVFRWAGGAWRLVMTRNNGADLAAVGSDIRETQFVLRPTDAHCFPTGGTRARTWHWNGTRFTAGPWKQATPGTAPPADAFKYGYFKTPSRNIQCDYGFGGTARAYVRCGIKSGLKPAPPSRGTGCFQAPWVSLGPTGRAQIGPSTCPGEDALDAGPFAGAGVGQMLAYGKAWSGGGLRCTSAITGLTCRNKSGHGFFLSREHWRAF